MTIDEYKHHFDQLLDRYSAEMKANKALASELDGLTVERNALLDAVHGFRSLVDTQKLAIARLEQQLHGRS